MVNRKLFWNYLDKAYLKMFKFWVWLIIIVSILTLLICSPILILVFLIVVGILITIKTLIKEIKEW